MADIPTPPDIFVPVAYADKNNVVGGAGTVSAVTIEELNHPFCSFSFSIKYTGSTAASAFSGFGAGFMAVVSLVTRPTAEGPYVYDFPNSPVTLTWQAGTNAGTIKEVYKHYDGAQTLLRDNIEPGSGAIGTGVSGPRYTILLAGTEYRLYEGYVPNLGKRPLLVLPSPSSGYPFPFRLSATLPAGFISIENITIGGSPVLTTIYSEREQIEDFGSTVDTLHYRIYQKSRFYPQAPHGLPLDGIARDYLIDPDSTETITDTDSGLLLTDN